MFSRNSYKRDSSQGTVYIEQLKDDISHKKVSYWGTREQLVDFCSSFDPKYQIPHYILAKMAKVATVQEGYLTLICDEALNIKKASFSIK